MGLFAKLCKKKIESTQRKMLQRRDNLISRIGAADTIYILLVPGEQRPAIISDDNKKYCCICLDVGSPSKAILKNVANNAGIPEQDCKFGEFSPDALAEIRRTYDCGIVFMEKDTISYMGQ